MLPPRFSLSSLPAQGKNILESKTMRIIAGIHRGRRILPPSGRTTRPITDRVKESLFAILTGRIPGARVADLFAGTGSLGLETLSREAQFCCFVERDRHALRLLKQNIHTLALEEKTRVAAKNAWLFPRWYTQPEPFNLIFIDPPYAQSRNSGPSSALGKLLARLSEPQILSPDGTVVVRHEAAYPPATNYDRLQLSQSRRYGAMALSFLQPASQAN